MVVIDASVAYKWSDSTEQFFKQAREILKHHLHHKRPIIVPDLVLYELGNVWATKTNLALSHVESNLEDLNSFRLNVKPVTFELIKKATKLAKSCKVSVYDAVYVVLAQQDKCDLVTADMKLFQKINLPFVKLLEQYTN